MSEELGELLAGWGAPPPRPGFADRVLGRVDAGAPAPVPVRRWGPARAFALGGVVGGLLVGSATLLQPAPPAPASAAGRTHLQLPGIAEVVGEPGSQVQWRRGDDGAVVVEVMTGAVWVRRMTESREFAVVAGGEAVSLGGACGRVAVTRSFLGVDVAVEAVSCDRVELQIEQARAELPRGRSR